MRRSVLTGAILGAAVTAVSATYANAQTFHTDFSGFFEVGALNNETGAIFSTGQATLTLKLDKKLQSLTYTLTYSNLSANVTQAHIHFGKVHVPGGIMVFFCSNLPNPPPATPACPNPSGTVTGTLTPASVQAVPGQHILAGSFDALTAALLSETAYGNIHTTNFPAGEIRGEISKDRQGE